MKRVSVAVLSLLGLAGVYALQAVGFASMITGAHHFLASLTSEQRAKATFSFGDEERSKWHFSAVSRNGLPLRDLAPGQKKLAQALLGTALSPEGIRTANQIMYLDQVLFELENGNPRRDPEGYFLSFFGTPSPQGIWGWRFEGHHLSLNYTLRDGQVISATPFFWGANPAKVLQGPNAGLKTLAEEEEMGRRLFKILTGPLQKKALMQEEAPSEIITGVARQVEAESPRGVARSEMTAEQADLLLRLVETYAARLHPDLSAIEMNRIRQKGLEQIYFAWAGGDQPGQPHYYRIQGPSFLIEYDNTQNSANHIHTVWRNFENDFGRDLLREHYARSHGLPTRVGSREWYSSSR